MYYEIFSILLSFFSFSRESKFFPIPFDILLTKTLRKKAVRKMKTLRNPSFNYAYAVVLMQPSSSYFMSCVPEVNLVNEGEQRLVDEPVKVELFSAYLNEHKCGTFIRVLAECTLFRFQQDFQLGFYPQETILWTSPTTVFHTQSLSPCLRVMSMLNRSGYTQRACTFL